jgi:hypothetical protein
MILINVLFRSVGGTELIGICNSVNQLSTDGRPLSARLLALSVVVLEPTRFLVESAKDIIKYIAKIGVNFVRNLGLDKSLKGRAVSVASLVFNAAYGVIAAGCALFTAATILAYQLGMALLRPSKMRSWFDKKHIPDNRQPSDQNKKISELMKKFTNFENKLLSFLAEDWKKTQARKRAKKAS